MSDRVTITRNESGVAHVELARPDKLNALDFAMFEGIIRAGRTLAEDRSLRCVVLSGQGRGFSAGLDVASFMAAGDVAAKLLERPEGNPANLAQEVAHVWTELPVPVIAAVHGVCFGGGLQIALGADIRIVAPDTRMSVMEIKWGLVPDMSGTQTLRHLVRLDVAKELAFTGRIVSGEEACSLGLATRCAADPLSASKELAETIAGKSPDAIRACKRLFNQSVRMDLAAGFRLETDLQLGLLGSLNQIEAVMANVEKRPPRFVDPSR
jgi:enoyl-CoA hydratase/carnithine racemase